MAFLEENPAGGMKIQVKEGGGMVLVVEGRKGGLSKWRETDFSRERYVCIHITQTQHRTEIHGN